MDDVIKLRKYIGRDYNSFNCFQLVQEFYKDQFKLDLAHYWQGRAPNRDVVESLVVSNKGDFVEVKDPQYGDIILLKLYGIECHMGIFIGGGRFLHSVRNMGSLIDRLERYSKLIAGYYRHREINDQA